MAVNTYAELHQHIGHKIVCVGYGDGEIIPFDNVAIECETCYEVLLDYDLEQETITEKKEVKLL